MKPFKFLVQPRYKQFLLGVVTILTLSLPAKAKSGEAQAVPSSVKPLSGSESRSAQHSHKNNLPMNLWDIGWKTLSVVGFLSGMSSLGIYWYDSREKSMDARRRLKYLEDGFLPRDKILQDLNGLRNQLRLHENQTDKSASDYKELTSRQQESAGMLSTQQASISDLAKQLRIIQSQLSSHNPIHNLTSPNPPKVPPPILFPLPESPADEVAAEYQTAVHRNDKGHIRQMAQDELDITQGSEEDLMLGPFAGNTKLQVVQERGSYLRIDDRNGQHLLVPTLQTLEGFTTNQPPKGIFDYKKECVCKAELRRPAEVQEIGDGVWEVINKGIVVVPA